MSSSLYSDTFKFPKLNGSNYSSWADHIQSALQARMLWLIVSGIKTVPPKAEESSMSPSEFQLARKEWLEWMQRDQAAQGSIKGACEDSQLPYVVDCKSSQEMWARLKKVHQENQSKINMHYYFKDLYTRKYAEGSSMADHIAAMLNIKHRIEQASETIPDLYVARAMILSLPKTQS